MDDYVRSMRALVGSRRIFVPGVRAIIVNSAGEVLLQHRTDTALWGVPGGAVELGESALDALKREVAEEAGVQVLQAEPMALYAGADQEFTYPNGDQIQCFAVAFIVRAWQGIPRADGTEGGEVRFFPMSSLPVNLVTTHRRTLEDFRTYDGAFVVT